MARKYGCSEEKIKHYDCQKISEDIHIDGNLNKKPWIEAVKSPRFEDMVTGVPGFFDTRCAVLWSETYLYVGFWVQEPNVKGVFKNRDDQVYLENDVEVFIGGEDCYYEFQINALGTIYEVFYIWQDAYTPDSRFNIPEFSFFNQRVDVLGGFQDVSRYKKHPRGARWAFQDWDLKGIKTAVQVDGEINNESVIDRGWSVEIAFPWSGMMQLFGERGFQFKDRGPLRMDFSRFEKLCFNHHQPHIHPGWSFNQHGVYDSHIPECFTYVHLKD